MAVTIDKDACIGCGACVGGCPVGALSLDDEGNLFVTKVLALTAVLA